MLLVRTKLGLSSIEGIGCFAAEKIPASTIVWHLDKRFDIEYASEVVESFPQVAKDFLKREAYLSKSSGNYILCPDNAHFFNHSNEPNVASGVGENENVSIAARDIEIGEEITENYQLFDRDFDYKMSI